MTTTGIAGRIGSQLVFQTTGADGIMTTLPAAVLTDVAGNPLAFGGGGGGSGDLAVTVYYTANVSGTGFAAGDVLAHSEVYVPGATNTAVSGFWANLTQTTVLTTNPTIANLTLLGTGGSGTTGDLSDTEYYTVIANGAGISAGDIVARHLVYIPGSVDTVASAFWSNLNAGTILTTAPSYANLQLAGGSGGGAVTMADGASVALGAKADSAATNGTSAWSLIALMKWIGGLLSNPLAVFQPADPSASNDLSAVNAAVTIGPLSGQGSLRLHLKGFPAGFVGQMQLADDISFTNPKIASFSTPTGVVNSSPTAAGYYRYIGVPGFLYVRFIRTDTNGGSCPAFLSSSSATDNNVVVSTIADNFLTRIHAIAQAVGAVLTAGTTNALSLDLNSNLRVLPAWRTSKVTASLTVAASSAYAAGNEVGGLMTFANVFDAAQSGTLQSIRLRINSAQTAQFKLYLFTTNPAATTWTDKTTPAINATDQPYAIGPFILSGGDSGLGASTFTTIELDGICAKIVASSTSLYGIMVTTGIPNFGASPVVAVDIVTEKD